jgi:hypothetical protein
MRILGPGRPARATMLSGHSEGTRELRSDPRKGRPYGGSREGAAGAGPYRTNGSDNR